VTILTSFLSSSTQPTKLRISCCLSLLGIIGVSALSFTGDNSWLSTLLQCLPFIIVAPGLVLGWYRSYSWLSLLILLYFIIAVTHVMAPDGDWLDALLTALTVVVFFSATFSSRWLQQRLHQHSDGTPSSEAP
jgi:uncharacterized membrane protein